jgi:hypothetical protein
MSNRIQKLAAEAKASVPQGLAVEQWIETYNETFAKLIVAECIEVAKHSILSGSGVDPSTFDGTVTTAEKIKEHFQD